MIINITSDCNTKPMQAVLPYPTPWGVTYYLLRDPVSRQYFIPLNDARSELMQLDTENTFTAIDLFYIHMAKFIYEHPISVIWKDWEFEVNYVYSHTYEDQTYLLLKNSLGVLYVLPVGEENHVEPFMFFIDKHAEMFRDLDSLFVD